MQPIGGTSSSQVNASGPVVRVAGHPASAGSNVEPHAATATEPTAAHVAAAVSSANKTMKAIDATVEFEVDAETKKTVIKVIDTSSNTVLRQVPAQEMLDIAQALDHMQGLLVKQKA